MSDVVKGWRKRIGVTTLMLACLLAAGWVRSMTRLDLVYLKLPGCKCVVVSGEEKVSVVYNAVYDLVSEEFERKSVLYVEVRLVPNSRYTQDDKLIKWQTTKASVVNIREDDDKRACTTHYPMAVIPLTAISAFLLLSRPRQSNQTKTTEPITWKTD